MAFVDHAAEYLVASDRAVDGHGDWPVVVVGGALVERLVRTMAVVVPGVRRQDPVGFQNLAWGVTWGNRCVGALRHDRVPWRCVCCT